MLMASLPRIEGPSQKAAGPAEIQALKEVMDTEGQELLLFPCQVGCPCCCHELPQADKQ